MRLSNPQFTPPANNKSAPAWHRHTNRTRLLLILLLILPIALLSVAPAAAQSTIWSATLTPAAPSGGGSGYCAGNASSQCWYETSVSPFGTLTDDDFTIGSRSYTVRMLGYSVDGSAQTGLLLNSTLAGVDHDHPEPASRHHHLHLSRRLLNSGTILVVVRISTVGPGNDVLPGRSALAVSVRLTGPAARSGSSGSSGSRSSRSSAPFATATPRPAVRTCDAFVNGIVVGGAPHGAQCQRLNDAGVGNEQVIAAGYIAAIDVWSYIGDGLEVCFEAKRRNHPARCRDRPPQPRLPQRLRLARPHLRLGRPRRHRRLDVPAIGPRSRPLGSPGGSGLHRDDTVQPQFPRQPRRHDHDCRRQSVDPHRDRTHRRLVPGRQQRNHRLDQRAACDDNRHLRLNAGATNPVALISSRPPSQTP